MISTANSRPDWLEVACPYCNAQVGEPCITPHRFTHKPRIELAKQRRQTTVSQTAHGWTQVNAAEWRHESGALVMLQADGWRAYVDLRAAQDMAFQSRFAAMQAVEDLLPAPSPKGNG